MIGLGRRAETRLAAEKELVIIPGALDEVARLAEMWVERYLVAT